MSKLTETNPSELAKTTPSLLDNVEGYLESLESAPKPWFLCTSVIYKAVKDSITALPLSKEVFEKAVGGISSITTYINSKTSAGIQVFDLDKAYELVGELDGLLADQFIVMDDGLDGLRAMLSVNLKQLIGSIVEHKEFIEKTATEKIGQADKEMKARYEQVTQLLDKYLQTVKEKYPEKYKQTIQTYEQVINKANEYKTTVVTKADEYKSTVDKAVSDYYQALRGKAVSGYEATVNTVVETQNYLLKTAQPYVQDAVARSQPYIAQAQPYVEPIVEKAKPYIEPVHDALQQNAYVGAYVKTATETAMAALEDAKTYCGLQNDATAAEEKVEEVPSTTSAEPSKISIPENETGVAAH